jgi:hypothetical protein
MKPPQIKIKATPPRLYRQIPVDKRYRIIKANPIPKQAINTKWSLTPGTDSRLALFMICPIRDFAKIHFFQPFEKAASSGKN